jgi:hypothetical protein
MAHGIKKQGLRSGLQTLSFPLATPFVALNEHFLPPWETDASILLIPMTQMELADSNRDREMSSNQIRRQPRLFLMGGRRRLTGRHSKWLKATN